jgi:hypothetical protein
VRLAPYAKDERVQDRRRWGTRQGVIVERPTTVQGLRACVVHWDDGGKEVCYTRDLRRVAQARASGAG